MDDKNEDPKDSGMCFDSMNFSELRKLMGKEGIGSLCKEMMSKMVRAENGESVCLQFMRQMKAEKDETSGKAAKNSEE